jgi:hypothetical protein
VALILRAGAAAEEPHFHVLFTSVAQNRHGRWRIAALRTMVPRKG